MGAALMVAELAERVAVAVVAVMPVGAEEGGIGEVSLAEEPRGR